MYLPWTGRRCALGNAKEFVLRARKRGPLGLGESRQRPRELAGTSTRNSVAARITQKMRPFDGNHTARGPCQRAAG
jgi:hypothetical protein